MAFTPIPNGVRVVHLGHVGNVQIVNTVGAVNGDEVAGSSLTSIAQSHGDAWRSKILPILVSGYTHDQTLAYSLEDQSLAPGQAAFTATATGGITGIPASLNACLVVALKTAKRGRTYAGRMFLSAVSRDNLTNDGVSWAPGLISAGQNAFNAYKAQVDPAIGHNGRLAVCSKGSLSKGIEPGVEAVTSIICRPAVGTQRRRLS